ncbi:hypothetical protein LLH00_00655 [bacterium]|nr:hypothetical protein [bacterium]
MRGIGRYLLPLMLLFAPGWLPGQYVGVSRPLVGGALLDSLAARKADRDFIRAGSNIIVTPHGSPSRPDSVTISSTASGESVSFISYPGMFSLTGAMQANVMQITALSDYAHLGAGAWGGASAWGYVGRDYAHYQTDTLALWAAYNTNGGGYDSLTTNIDLTHFATGDTSLATDYICASVYMKQAWIDNLNAGGGIYLGLADVSRNNVYYYIIPKGTLVSGFSYVKLRKTDFGAYGSPSWGAVRMVLFGIWGATAGGMMDTVVVDNFQLIRKDMTNTRPNGLWLTGKNWWQGTANSSLVPHREDSTGVQAMVSGDYITSLLSTPDTLGPLKIRVAQTDSSILAGRCSGGLTVRARSGKIFLDSAGVHQDSVSYPYAAKAIFTVSLIRSPDGAATALVHAGAGQDSILTGHFSSAALDYAYVGLYSRDRLLYGLPKLHAGLTYFILHGFKYWSHADSLTQN